MNGHGVSAYGFSTSNGYPQVGYGPGGSLGGGSLAAYYDSGTVQQLNGSHVFYFGSDNHVHDMHNGGQWADTDLTVASGTYTVSGWGLTGFFDGRVPHVFYTTADGLGGDGHVMEMYYDGRWWWHDLTNVTHDPAVSTDASVALTSFFDGTTVHVFYTGWVVATGHPAVRELYYNSAGWQTNDITNVEGDNPTPMGAISGFWDGQRQHVFFAGSDGSGKGIHERYHDSAWHATNVTKNANGPSVGSQYDTLGFHASLWDGKVEHVFHPTSDGHVHELYLDGLWHDHDLTHDTGAALAVP